MLLLASSRNLKQDHAARAIRNSVLIVHLPEDYIRLSSGINGLVTDDGSILGAPAL